MCAVAGQTVKPDAVQNRIGQTVTARNNPKHSYLPDSAINLSFFVRLGEMFGLNNGEESPKLFVVTMVLNTCELLVTWARNQGVVIQYTQPGKPQQNAYVERYNRTVRHEWLDQHLFESIDHATEIDKGR